MKNNTTNNKITRQKLAIIITAITTVAAGILFNVNKWKLFLSGDLL